MDTKEIFEILQPLNEILRDKGELRLDNHKKFSLGDKEKHDLILWYNSDYNESVRVFVNKDIAMFIIENNDNTYIRQHIYKDKLSENILKYFIEICHKRMKFYDDMEEHKRNLNNGIISKEFIRKLKVDKIIKD